MKKLAITTALILGAMCAQAQTSTELLRFSQQDFGGITARSAAMAGAFTSLGADLSSLSINPAGMAMYSSSEFAITGGLNIASNKSTYGNDNYLKAVRTTATLPNLGGVLNLGNFNIGFAANRLASFNGRTSTVGNYEDFNSITRQWVDQITGIGHSNIESANRYNQYNPLLWNGMMAYNGFLIDPAAGTTDGYTLFGIVDPGDQIAPEYIDQTKGYINEYALSMAYDFNDIIYLGMTFGFQETNYQHNSLYREYNNLDGHESGTLDQFTLRQNLNIQGFGFNMKFGVTVRPTDWLRIGVAYHTPTWNTYNEISNRDLNPYFTAGEGKQQYSPDLVQDYRARTPNRLLAGVSTMLGRRVMLSFDADFTWYGDMKFNTDINLYGWREGTLPNDIENLPNQANYISRDGYIDLNAMIRDSYAKSSQSYRFGAEWRVISGLFLRGGLAYTTSPYANLESFYAQGEKLSDFGSQMRYSGGVGYRTGSFSVDLAYTYTDYKHLPAKFFDYVTTNGYDTGWNDQSGQPIVYQPGELISSWENINQHQQNHNILLTFGWRF